LGGSEEDIKARIAAAWKKWQQLTGVLCDRRIPIAVKRKVYSYQGIVPNGEGEPMWLTPHQRDLQPEGER